MMTWPVWIAFGICTLLAVALLFQCIRAGRGVQPSQLHISPTPAAQESNRVVHEATSRIEDIPLPQQYYVQGDIDLYLEVTMRQAQMGLFVLPGKEKSM